MPMKRYKPEQVVTLLRQIEVEIANGKTTPQACRDAQITVQTFYRWRKEYDGLKLEKERMLHDQHPYTLFYCGPCSETRSSSDRGNLVSLPV